MPIDRDPEIIAEAETAKARLRLGIARSKALVGQYRARLSMLSKGAPPAGDRQLFRMKS